MVVDHLRDDGRAVLHLMGAHQNLIPRLKTASAVLPREKAAWAWPEERLFPIDTPEDTTLSLLYVGLQSTAVPEAVQRKVAGAALAYGIPVPRVLELLQQQKTASAPLPPVEDSPEDFAMPGPKRLRIKTAGEVKQAAETLAEWGGRVPLRERAAAAVRIVKAAAAKGMSTAHIPTSTLKMAGLFAGDSRHIVRQLHLRSAALVQTAPDRAKVAAAAEQLWAQSRRSPYIFDRESLVKLAELVEAIDLRNGLNDYWGRHLEDPLTMVFSSDKIAEAVVELDGLQASLAKLTAVPVETYADILGADVVEEIAPGGTLDAAAIADIFPTLPLPMKTALRAAIGPVVRV